MGMILRIASSRIVGQGDIVGRSGYFSLNLSANSVMRGRLDARRTLKSLVADLRMDITLSLVGRNLWMIYCKAPFDPESVATTGNYYQGIDYFMMPSLRSVGFNLKLKF